MQMPSPQGNLGLYKSRLAELGSFAKPRGLPGGMFALGIGISIIHLGSFKYTYRAYQNDLKQFEVV